MATRSTRRGGQFSNVRPGGLALNKKDFRSVREVTLNNHLTEYLYLRENQLTEFDTDVVMENLKVLDLSINEIGGTVDFLGKTPFLRHLYLTGNKIESLHGIANFASLETLCLSDNAINNFEGLEGLSNLRVLSLNFNNISSFEHYPNLPSLHTLNLVGNPITDIPSYRSMAIAINNSNLVSVDGNPVKGEERAAVEHYQGKVVYCICEGFIVEGDNVEEASDAFLLKLQRVREKSKYLQLCSIRLAPEDASRSVLTEGVPVRLTCCLHDIRPYEQRTTDIFYSPHLYPITFRVAGEATEVFVVGSMNNWTDPIEMERCEEGGEIYFHTTLYLPIDDYEYRYIVDGVEIVPEAEAEAEAVASKHKQGICYLYKVTGTEQQQEEGDTILHVRWMKSTPGNYYTVIEDKNSLVYVPTSADVGSCLRAEVLAYVNGVYSFLYFDISTPIVAGPPTCPFLEIKGNLVEGNVLMAEADYVGGTEGSSSINWFRVTADDEEVPIPLNAPWDGYKLTNSDIGCRIKAVFTPVRNDWMAGEPKVQITAPVVAGAPECESIKIIGNLIQGSALDVEVVYSGGTEGESYYQWLRKDENSEDYFPIENENATRYISSLEDVGKYLAVDYTPVNDQGEEGETCRSVLENPIEPSAPEICNLKIVGELEEQHVLTLEYEYTGGHFGPHMIQWLRRDRYRRLAKIGRPNSATLSLTKREVDCTIEVSITPVRFDGVQGCTVIAKTENVISAGTPQTTFVNVVGEPRVGQTLELELEYFGGEPGEPIIEWARENPVTEEFVVIEVGSRTYTIRPEDQGRMIRVTYTPVRTDGTVGEAKSRIVQVPHGDDDILSEKMHQHVDPNADLPDNTNDDEGNDKRAASNGEEDQQSKHEEKENQGNNEETSAGPEVQEEVVADVAEAQDAVRDTTNDAPVGSQASDKDFKQ